MLETNASIATFLQTRGVFGLGLDYDRRLPELLRAVTLEDVRRRRAPSVLRSANAPCIAVAGLASLGRRSPRSARQAPRDSSAVFFDVDFTLIHPGPTFQGAGYARVLRAARRRDRPRRVQPRSSPRLRLLDAVGQRLRPARSSSTTRGASSSGWAAAGRASTPAARDIYDGMGRPASTSPCTTKCPTSCASCTAGIDDRPHLEHTAVPDVVPVAFRARGLFAVAISSSDARLHEAASVASSSGAAPAGSPPARR